MEMKSMWAILELLPLCFLNIFFVVLCFILISHTPKKGFALPTLKKHLSRKSSLDQLQVSSPSSPDPTKAVKRGPQLTRSATLPKVPQSPNKSAPLTAELDALEVDSTLLENIRRWILGIAVDQRVFILSRFTAIQPGLSNTLIPNPWGDHYNFQHKAPRQHRGIHTWLLVLHAEDTTMKRGYEQKSLIQLPARQLLEIGFLGTMIHVEIPHTGNDVQQISNTMLRENHSRSALHLRLVRRLGGLEIFCVRDVLISFLTGSFVYLYTEQILLAGEIRLYSTILVDILPSKSGLILGVTNPYFDRSWLGLAAYSKLNFF
ncbi:hypothetical protein EV360DRAFT_73256 [Lentinula raphanica]|nr:hypothetical protein EV360DRAFT_73256 [Lentinula raphanica]